jgi:hypothetical protein
MNNQTVIDTIVKYSKDCIVLRFIKRHFEKSLLLGKNLPQPFILPSINTLKIIIDEISMRIDEREGDIGKLLTPLFEGKDFGHKNSNKHSLTINEMRDGYIMLDGEKYVILLRPLKDNQLAFNYSAGVLYELTGELEKNLAKLNSTEENVLHDLFNLIINKKTSYGYLS